MRFCLDVVLITAVLGVAMGASPAFAAPNSVAPAGREGTTATLPPTQWVVKVDARTGRLVRTLVVAPQAAGRRMADVHGLVAEAARTFNVNPLLIDSVIQVESNYNPFAVSPKGAQGLMQLMPATAQRFGVTEPFDPKQNIEAGVRYLRLLQDTFQDDRLAIAAYNAGEKAVARYGDVPPYSETINYVSKVGKKYGQAQRAAGQDTKDQVKNQAKNVEDPTATEEEPKHILAYVDSEGKLHLATR
jgi:soluble lytic murein transglycosylase-like protein